MDQSITNRIEGQLAALWERNLPTLHERLALLDRAAAAAANNSLSPEDQKQACGIAHKLAGLLGMFGYTQGTEIARRLEVLLDTSPTDPGELIPLTIELRRSVFPAS